MDKTNFPHKLLLADKQASWLHKAFANGSIVKNCTIRRSSSWHTHFENTFLSAAKKKCFSWKFSKKILYKQIDRFNKEYKTGSEITLTHNKIKDIIKIINFPENRGILLKGTNRKSSSQMGEFLNSLKSLMTAGLALI